MTFVMLRSTAKKCLQRWGLPSMRYYSQISPAADRLIAGYNVAPNKMTAISHANYSDEAKTFWKRPEGPPQIWHAFEGKKKSEIGTPPRFTIQDVPKDMVEDVIDFMLKYLLEEEAMCIALGLAKDPLAVENMRTHWRNTLRQGVSIVALTENPEPRSKPVIVGANFLTVVTVQDKAHLRSLDQFKSKQLKRFYSIVFSIEDEVDVLAKYGIDKYLGSVGLVCHPSFRGHNIGRELLKVREAIGRAYQIPATEAMFTMTASQISASRAGYELQLQKEYSELSDYEGKLIFPEAKGNFIHVMTKRLY